MWTNLRCPGAARLCAARPTALLQPVRAGAAAVSLVTSQMPRQTSASAIRLRQASTVSPRKSAESKTPKIGTRKLNTVTMPTRLCLSSANTTPGNKQGGLSNIVEKAMGSIVKSGTGPIHGVIAPGEKLRQKGLIFAATPASDFICGTLQLAAGMNLHVFTTGRGTPYGLAECPVIKVATRDDLARRWHDLMDINAGRIASGEATIEDVGTELFQLLLAVASGKKTWAEHWKLHNALVLFNPAPVT